MRHTRGQPDDNITPLADVVSQFFPGIQPNKIPHLSGHLSSAFFNHSARPLRLKLRASRQRGARGGGGGDFMPFNNIDSVLLMITIFVSSI